MNLHRIKIEIILELLFCSLMIYLIITSLFFMDYHKLFLSILAMFCSFIPFIITKIARKKSVYIPKPFTIIFLLFIFFSQYLGEIRNFYYRIWWWDILLHVVSGILFVLGGYFFINELRKRAELTIKSPFFTSLFIFSISMTLETFWEVFEFLGDYFFNTNMLKSGLNDTITDTIVNILGAFAASIVFYFKERKKLVS